MFHSIAAMFKLSDMNMARHHVLQSFPSLPLPPSPFLSPLSSPTLLSCPPLSSTSVLLSSTSSLLLPSLSLPFIGLSSPALSPFFYHPLFSVTPLGPPASPCLFPPFSCSPSRLHPSFPLFPSGLPSVAFPCRCLASSVVNNGITMYLASPSSLFLTFTFEPGHMCLLYSTTVWMRFGRLSHLFNDMFNDMNQSFDWLSGVACRALKPGARLPLRVFSFRVQQACEHTRESCECRQRREGSRLRQARLPTAMARMYWKTVCHTHAPL